MRTFDRITELTGGTPLLKLTNFMKDNDLSAELYAKLECMNPAGSAKDRVGIAMLDDAEKKGKIGKNATVIEPTSGNTGIGIAVACAVRGYRAILTMPETMSIERQKLLRAYGAEIVLTDGKKGMSGAIEKANAEAHYDTTGPEIWNDTDGRVDIFVAGVGTGGTLTGVGRYLKEKNPNVKIIAVEPADSPVLSKGKGGAHGIQGIGAGFVPPILDTSLIDEVFTVTTEESYTAARAVAKRDGVLVGISSGAAVYIAGLIAKRPENKGKMIVALLPDTGERYLSTPLFD